MVCARSNVSSFGSYPYQSTLYSVYLRVFCVTQCVQLHTQHFFRFWRSVLYFLSGTVLFNDLILFSNKVSKLSLNGGDFNSVSSAESVLPSVAVCARLRIGDASYVSVMESF